MKNKLLFLRHSLVAFAYDCCMTAVVWLLAYWLRFDLHLIPSMVFYEACKILPLVLLAQSFCFYFYGLYRGVWRFASIPDLARIVKAVAMGTLVIVVLCFFLRSHVILPRSVPLVYASLLIGALACGRATYRWLKDYRHVFFDNQKVLIIGAGSAGESLVRDLIRHAKHLYQPVGFLDDNFAKLHREIHGVSVVGTCYEVAYYADKLGADLILIAIPSADVMQMRRIVELCATTKLPYRTLPGVGDVAEGKVDIKQLREVALDDLLGRAPVALDWQSSSQFQDKVIMVCGGGGSIGSELCRQLAHLGPTKLIIVDQNEYNLYEIDMALKKRFPYLQIISLLQDITDRVGLQNIFATHAPQIVFHAAAYKHVPLVEAQCRAGIYNNVIGTQILAEIAAEFSSQKFILISTDKAVNPTNRMGATKRAAEIFCQNFNAMVSTEFITVRFGNVLDSAGSVVPLFRKQLQEGGPLTVTHPDITRYFMTIPEATLLIMQAALMGKGGEIFVLDMGEPIKISYLAEQMIRLAGKIPHEEIAITYTGLRPGEKLYEELFHEQEALQKTHHPKIFLADARKVAWANWLNTLELVKYSCINEENEKQLQQLLCQLVPEYISSQGQAEANFQPDNIVSIDAITIKTI